MNEIGGSIADILAQRTIEAARNRVRERGSRVVLDNAVKAGSEQLTSARRMGRQPVIGTCLVLLGFAFVTGSLYTRDSPSRQLAVGVTIGLMFAVAGYGLVTFQDVVTFDRSVDRWESRRGVPPIVTRAAGSTSSIAALRCRRATRQAYTSARGRTAWSYQAWVVECAFRDESVAQIALGALDLPCNLVHQEQAMKLYHWFAALVDLPISGGEG